MILIEHNVKDISILSEQPFQYIKLPTSSLCVKMLLYIHTIPIVTIYGKWLQRARPAWKSVEMEFFVFCLEFDYFYSKKKLTFFYLHCSWMIRMSVEEFQKFQNQNPTLANAQIHCFNQFYLDDHMIIASVG